MKVLVVEDDKKLSDLLKLELEKQKYVVDTFEDGELALMSALNNDLGYDIILLDRMLPNINGLTILKVIREKNIAIPVIMITGMDGIDDKIAGLDEGADDYMVKPFSIDELLARMRALIRRPPAIKDINILKYMDISLDISKRLLYTDSQSVKLTQKETDLMEVFLKNPEGVLSRDQIIYKVWGVDATIEQSNVDNYICFLRRRLKSLNCKCSIETVFGKGFRLEDLHG